MVSLAPTAAQPHLPPRITIVLPALLHGRATGGPNTAFNIGARLHGAGLRVRFVSIKNQRDNDLALLREHVAQLGELTDGAAAIEFATWSETAPLPVEPDESFMATAWQTAYTAQAALQHTAARAFYYLIQDYEPAFSAWSSNFALAAATYTMPHRAIFNDPALRDYLYAQAPESRAAAPQHISFHPAVDGTLFAPPTEPRTRPHLLLFYARPHAQRNAFEIGLHALRAAVARGALRAGEWEIRSIGAPLPSFDLGAGQTLINDPWRDFPSYAAQMRRASIAFALSISPVSGYPVREIAATGGFAVTNTFANKDLASLRAISPRIYAAPATVDDMATQLVHAATAVAAG
ncbi:MAG: hypothetical protein EBV77_12335, partial [Gemmatimonadaceae bacterium]|nr:hypothetical protein [Gemmatimonadaceae bacterium]